MTAFLENNVKADRYEKDALFIPKPISEFQVESEFAVESRYAL